MSIEDIGGKASPQIREAFAYLREQMKLQPNVQESLEFEPLKDCEAPSYNINGTPRVRVFFGEKLEIFLFIPEKSVPKIRVDESVPQALRNWIDKAQLGGMSRLLRVQLASRVDVDALLPLVLSILKT